MTHELNLRKKLTTKENHVKLKHQFPLHSSYLFTNTVASTRSSTSMWLSMFRKYIGKLTAIDNQLVNIISLRSNRVETRQNRTEFLCHIFKFIQKYKNLKEIKSGSLL